MYNLHLHWFKISDHYRSYKQIYTYIYIYISIYIYIRKRFQQFLGDDVSEVFDNGDSNIMTPAWTEKIGFSKQSKNKKQNQKQIHQKHTLTGRITRTKTSNKSKPGFFPDLFFVFFCGFLVCFFLFETWCWWQFHVFPWFHGAIFTELPNKWGPVIYRKGPVKKRQVALQRRKNQDL